MKTSHFSGFFLVIIYDSNNFHICLQLSVLTMMGRKLGVNLGKTDGGKVDITKTHCSKLYRMFKKTL